MGLKQRLLEPHRAAGYINLAINASSMWFMSLGSAEGYLTINMACHRPMGDSHVDRV
jgi:hypothetical protein